MSPHHRQFTKPTPVAIPSASDGLPEGSWWADPEVTREAFTDRAKIAAERMKQSKFGRVNVMAME